MSRLTELDEFKHWLCNLNQSPFHLEDDDGSIQFRPNLGTKEDDDKQQNLSTSKVNLMENMAQLWLQQDAYRNNILAVKVNVNTILQIFKQCMSTEKL